jgi:hypothetical protein
MVTRWVVGEGQGDKGDEGWGKEEDEEEEEEDTTAGRIRPAMWEEEEEGDDDDRKAKKVWIVEKRKGQGGEKICGS